jgi:hypothetical protein
MSYTPPLNTLNPTQRKSIGAGLYTKREREEHEATGKVINLMTRAGLQADHIPFQYVRPGSDHSGIKSRGFPC